MTGEPRAPRTVPDLRVLADAAALATAAAEEFARRAAEAVRARGRFAVALSGGATPAAMFERLATRAPSRFSALPWAWTHVFWGDERTVPPEHPDSNFRLAETLLLSRVPIPAANVHRVRAELPDAATAAAEYEAELRRFFRLGPGGTPRFDLVLLGLGADGHTASLFPGSSAVEERSRLVAATRVTRLGVERITLTLPVLNHAAAVAFLVSGEAKAAMLREVLEGDRPAAEVPAKLVRPDGDLVFLADAAAASCLTRPPR